MQYCAVRILDGRIEQPGRGLAGSMDQAPDCVTPCRARGRTGKRSEKRDDVIGVQKEKGGLFQRVPHAFLCSFAFPVEGEEEEGEKGEEVLQGGVISREIGPVLHTCRICHAGVRGRQADCACSG